MDEEWKDIKGYEGYYQVSNTGRVRSLDRTIINKNGMEKKLKGKELKFQERKSDTQGNNYRWVILYKNRKRETKYIHTLVLIAFKRNRPDGFQTRHKDGNGGNNNVTNLAWGTQSENHQDKLRHGRVPLGERVINSKLTKEEVIQIRKRYAAGGISQEKLGQLYNVSGVNIYFIVSRKSWGWLD